MGRISIFGNNKRPLVGEQNTGRDVYERPFSTGTVSVEGLGGDNNYRSLSPFNISSINSQYIALADISGMGSANGLNTNPTLRALIDQPNSLAAQEVAASMPTIGIGPNTSVQF